MYDRQDNVPKFYYSIEGMTHRTSTRLNGKRINKPEPIHGTDEFLITTSKSKKQAVVAQENVTITRRDSTGMRSMKEFKQNHRSLKNDHMQEAFSGNNTASVKLAFENVSSQVRTYAKARSIATGKAFGDAARSVFSDIDIDNSGALDKEEFIEGLHRMGVRLSTFETGLVFQLFDSDGNGSIE